MRFEETLQVRVEPRNVILVGLQRTGISLARRRTFITIGDIDFLFLAYLKLDAVARCLFE
jgi:hypothetical protein